MEEITRVTGVESLKELYREFFDPSWAEKFTFALQDTKLWVPGVDLVRNWLAASQARSWPWLMVEMVETSLQKKLEETVPLGTKKVRFIRDRLIDHLKAHGEKCRPAFYRKLEAALVELDGHADRAMETAREAVSHYTEDVWEQLIPLGPFHNMIWSSERAAYVSLYYNYECFLKECVRQARNLETYEFNAADVGKVFNEGLGFKCTNDQEVQVAKYTRTSLVHNGGRAIPKLLTLPHRHKIEGDEIQIGASETTRLYHILKGKAMLLAKAAKSVEALQLPWP